MYPHIKHLQTIARRDNAHAPYVWDGVRLLKCSEKSANAFLARVLAGYDIRSVPRFETTSAAVYGRLTLAKRGFYKGVTRVKVTEKENET